jgi:AraC-like DNA-binding protein
MEFKIHAPGGDSLQIFHGLPGNFKGHILPLHTPTAVLSDFGNMIFQNYYGDGFTIWFSNYNIIHQTEIIGRADIPVLELHIQFVNEFFTSWDTVGEKTMKQYQYNLTFTPFVQNKASFRGGNIYHTFDIHFTIPYLEKLSPHFPVLDKFLSKVVKGQPADMSKMDRYLAPSMIQIVNSLLNCPYKNGAAAFFIEAKVIELLLMVLQDCSEENPLGVTRLSNYDIEMLHMMKDHVAKEFENPLTLKELSKKFTINEFKLKKGFKYLFGTTVYDYMNNIRMDKAQQLVLETNLSINEIADLSGFEERAAFDKAFKKHFGYTAAYLRRHKK